MSNPNIKSLQNIINTHFGKLKSLVSNEPLVSDDNTFYIYTTGIANWGHSDNVLINAWKNYRYKNIIGQIPKEFKNIVIQHYDPILLISNGDDDFDTHQENIKNIIPVINQILSEQDNKSLTTDKKTKQTFIQESFDHNTIDKNKNHIILDFAHIYDFYYNLDLTNEKFYIKNKNSYRSSINNNIITQLDSKINCIYIPFPNNTDHYVENIRYFTYNNKKISSYIEVFFKLCSSLYNNPQYKNIINRNLYLRDNIFIFDHIDNFDNILNKILKQDLVYNYIRTKIGGVPGDLFKNKNGVDEEIKLINEFYKEFFDKLFESKTNETELFNIENYKVYGTINEYIEKYKKKNNIT